MVPFVTFDDLHALVRHEVATRDYVRGELQALLKELDERDRGLGEE